LPSLRWTTARTPFAVAPCVSIASTRQLGTMMAPAFDAAGIDTVSASFLRS